MGLFENFYNGRVILERVTDFLPYCSIQLWPEGEVEVHEYMSVIDVMKIKKLMDERNFQYHHLVDTGTPKTRTAIVGYPK